MMDGDDNIRFGKSDGGTPEKNKTRDVERSDKKDKAEKRRLKRSVKASRTLFGAIDVLFSHSQNACPYVDSKNIKSINCEKDVVYYDAEPKVCTMDIYRVSSERKQPAVVIVHGGGFSAGDKKYRKGQSQYFAINGFTVFSLNYGLAPYFVFPQPVNQLIHALNFIYENAEKFGIDRDRIIVAGDSAGAYYASVLGTISSNADYAVHFDKLDFSIMGLILNCGLYDMNTILKSKYMLNIDDGVFIGFTGMSRDRFDMYEYKDICMPFEHITDNYPPTFLLFAPGDIFCKEQGAILLERLEELGVYCEYYEAKHKYSIHCFSLNWRGEDAYAANELMMSFTKRLAAERIKFDGKKVD